MALQDGGIGEEGDASHDEENQRMVIDEITGVGGVRWSSQFFVD